MDKVSIIGLSEPMLTMVLDNFESNSFYPEIFIFNNLKRKNLIPFVNHKFKINITETINAEIFNLPAIIGVNKPNNKKQIIASFKKYNMEFMNLINGTSFLSSTVLLGHGIVINSLSSIAAFTKISNFVTINRNISIGHHSEIGKYSTINPGANIAGFVKIGEGVLIGMGVNIIENITIGSNSIIGAGSVVTKNIPENVVAYGNPCKVISHHEI